MHRRQEAAEGVVGQGEERKRHSAEVRCFVGEGHTLHPLEEAEARTHHLGTEVEHKRHLVMVEERKRRPALVEEHTRHSAASGEAGFLRAVRTVSESVATFPLVARSAETSRVAACQYPLVAAAKMACLHKWRRETRAQASWGRAR